MAYTRKTSDIITSYDLDYVLEQIKDNSEVARLLLKKRHSIDNLVDNNINFISISNSDKTKISYLTPERIDTLNERGEDLWTSTRRFHAKPGAIVSKLFKNVSSKEVEIFSTLFRNVQSKINFKFQVVSGRDIKYYYHGSTYHSPTGSLGVSCMKYDACQDYLGIYTKNEDIISLLVALSDDGRLIGRALLWKQGDKKIMDRIYTINDEDFQFAFKQWADENGYWYKKEQRWNNTLFFKTREKIMCEEICINLDYCDFDYYPYMDTFKFIDRKTKNIYNYIPKGVDVKTMGSAEGHFGGMYDFCQKSKLLYSIDDICFVPNLGIKVGSEWCVYSETFDLYILREDAQYDNSLNDWIYRDEDINNQVLIDKRKSEVKSRNSWTYSSQDFTIEDTSNQNVMFESQSDDLYIEI